jgi:predicted dehydrogenase
LSRRFGIGLVGAGRFGAFCLDAFSDLPVARVVAVTDSDRSRAAAIAPPGTVVHDDLEALLDDPAVDIVHIGTPPFLHGSMASRAAERGKHVFVEKPLATSLEEARAAIDAATSSGVQLSIDYVLRHHPLHRLAIALSRSGALGSLQHFALENFASAEALPPAHWFWDPAQSGGIHVEHGVHFFDLCLALVGREPDVVSGTAHCRADGRVDRVSAILGFGQQAAATFYHAFNRTDASERTTIRLAFERGHVVIDGWIPTRLEMDGLVAPAAATGLRELFGDLLRTRDTVDASGHASVQVKAASEMPDRQRHYRLAVRAGMTDLVAAIEGVRPMEVTAADGLRSLEIALRASRPAEERPTI